MAQMNQLYLACPLPEGPKVYHMKMAVTSSQYTVLTAPLMLRRDFCWRESPFLLSFFFQQFTVNLRELTGLVKSL